MGRKPRFTKEQVEKRKRAFQRFAKAEVAKAPDDKEKKRGLPSWRDPR